MRTAILMIAGVAALCFASQASANIMSVTYDGVATSGSDVQNLFGGGSLIGDTLTASFVYDTGNPDNITTGTRDLPGSSTRSEPGPYQELTGFAGSTPATSILSATYTITSAAGKNYSYSYTPDQQDYVGTGYGVFDYVTENDDVDGNSVIAVSQSQPGASSEVFIDTDDRPSTNLNATYASSYRDGSGVFSSETIGTGATATTDTIAFDVNSVAVAAVPEPSEWAFMIGGLGLGALVLRRRTRAGALPA